MSPQRSTPGRSRRGGSRRGGSRDHKTPRTLVKHYTTVTSTTSAPCLLTRPTQSYFGGEGIRTEGCLETVDVSLDSERPPHPPPRVTQPTSVYSTST